MVDKITYPCWDFKGGNVSVLWLLQRRFISAISSAQVPARDANCILALRTVYLMSYKLLGWGLFNQIHSIFIIPPSSN